VLFAVYKLVRDLGDIKDYIDDYLDIKATAALIKTYKTSDDWNLK